MARLALVMLALTTTLVLAAAADLKAFDGWSGGEISLLSSLHIRRLGAAPADPSNAAEAAPVAATAAALGKQLFFDKRLSGNGQVACASCHAPERQFQDSLPRGRGIGEGMRRTMPVVGAGHAAFLFWDGRKDSLWSQALGPLEDPLEHGGNRMAYARTIAAHYRPGYEAIFGKMPSLDGLPPAAGPSGNPSQQAAWAGLPAQRREDVSRVFANIGKAIAAYEKTLGFGPSRLDRYIEAVATRNEAGIDALDKQEKAGLRVFIGKGRCVTCHNGPLLTDQHFHNTGIPAISGKPDPGRSGAITKLLRDEFNCLGKFSDARPEQCEELRFLATGDPAMVSAFKTPGLRGVAARMPYMHAGQKATLRDVVAHYDKAPDAALGHSELRPLGLTPAEIEALLKFLETLASPILQAE
ncbi:cytochrome-c peroxidase [Noviherbaspirillum sp. 17J57-3]|uniref:Cytochrome-c peroxidase n=2 Tax=Noviherbaspirillum galbum TaxID=2709383 RepID=A0A6B3SU36_9BURK|nr:cytochrome-c peroxidase [Noviherbaspirillum galbum]